MDLRNVGKVEDAVSSSSNWIRNIIFPLYIFPSMVNRPHKNASGFYVIQGHNYQTVTGSRQQVMHGTAYKTKGELKKSDLMFNKWGRIVSKKKHLTAKKERRLEKHGFFAEKGKFGYVKKTPRRSTRKSK